jgi:hypothetical protein
MVRPVGSLIQRDSHLPIEARTVIPFQCRYAYMTKRFERLRRPSKTRGLGDKKNSVHLSDLINRQGS